MTGISTVNQAPLPPMFLALRRIANFRRIKSCDFYYIEEILKVTRGGTTGRARMAARRSPQEVNSPPGSLSHVRCRADTVTASAYGGPGFAVKK
eukprot:437096-Hanusia_phi.AAC.1